MYSWRSYLTPSVSVVKSQDENESRTPGSAYYSWLESGINTPSPSFDATEAWEQEMHRRQTAERRLQVLSIEYGNLQRERERDRHIYTSMQLLRQKHLEPALPLANPDYYGSPLLASPQAAKIEHHHAGNEPDPDPAAPPMTGGASASHRLSTLKNTCCLLRTRLALVQMSSR